MTNDINHTKGFKWKALLLSCSLIRSKKEIKTVSFLNFSDICCYGKIVGFITSVFEISSQKKSGITFHLMKRSSLR